MYKPFITVVHIENYGICGLCWVQLFIFTLFVGNILKILTRMVLTYTKTLIQLLNPVYAVVNTVCTVYSVHSVQYILHSTQLHIQFLTIRQRRQNSPPEYQVSSVRKITISSEKYQGYSRHSAFHES